MDPFLLIPLTLGWLAGLAINYLADVLPFTRRFSQPACRHCGEPYQWVNYFLLGNCSTCRTKRHWRTYAVQLLAVAAAFYVWFAHPPRLGFPLSIILLTYFGVVLVIDLEHRLILHPVSIAGAFLGLIVGSVLFGPVKSLIGGAFGFGIMYLFYYLGEVYLRILSRRRGEPQDEVALGFGDVNLSGVLGLVLGWPGIVAGLLFGILAGGVVSLFLIVGMLVLKKYRPNFAIPYAPYLILGAFVILFR